MRSLYDEIGGAPAVAAVVDDLYTRLVADERVGHHFDPDRLPSLKDGQRRWFTANLGGPVTGEVPDLRAAHTALDINDEQVTVVVEHLAESLRIAGVPPDTATRVVAVVSRLWFARNF